MTQLVVALVILSAFGAVCGYVYGLCNGFAHDEFANPAKHPVFFALSRPSNPFLNLLRALAAWAVFFFVVPKLVFLALGIEDISAFGMSAGAQLAFGVLGMFVGERRWKHVA